MHSFDSDKKQENVYLLQEKILMTWTSIGSPPLMTVHSSTAQSHDSAEQIIVVSVLIQ